MKNSPSLIKYFFVLILFAAHMPARAQEEEKTLVAGDYTFKIETPWVWQQPASSMRAGQLAYGESEDAPVAVFFHFAGGGGGIQANLDRWVGQFEGVPEKTQSKEEVSGVVIHLLEASGTFMDSMGGGPFSTAKKPKPGTMMLGAILESDRGPVFIKLTGPKAEVAALKEDFLKLVKSPLVK